MIKFLGLAVATALTVTASTASAGVLLLYPTDYNDFKSVNGGAYNAGTIYDKRVGRIGQLTSNYTSLQTTTYVAAAEFDLSTLPQNINVTSALLTDNFLPENNVLSTLAIIGTEYAGDGIVTAADVTATGTPFSYTGSVSNGESHFRMDVASFVQSLVNSGDQFAGFNFGSIVPTGCTPPAGSAVTKNCLVDVPFFSTTVPNDMMLSINYDVLAPAAAAVPEPATWAMMLVGVGAVGFGMRRRRKVVTQVSYAA